METLRLGSRGPNIKLIQSLLSRIGYQPGAVDGIFGPKTQYAIILFQEDNGLYPDGIVGPATWRIFESFLRGYDIYTIRPGDTLYSIARRYYTSIEAITTANPGISPLSLPVGQTLTIPYGIDVVFTDIDYTYEIMARDISGLKARYPFLEIGSAGSSVLRKDLYYLRLGTGPNQVFYNGAHHALEWITTPLLMKFCENFLKAYSTGKKIRGYDLEDVWRRSSIYIVPMVNPDGIDLVLQGLSPSNPYYQQLLQWNNTGRPFSQVWKANIRGVDLNVNYPADWEKAQEVAEALGIYGPAPENYPGPTPLSEPETISLVNFTRTHDFRLALAYHTQGRVIYWSFDDYAPAESLTIANLFSRVSGYTVATPPPEALYAGYKDWFLQEYRRPGYTIEVGIGRNPIPITQFNTIYDENEEILILGALV